LINISKPKNAAMICGIWTVILVWLSLMPASQIPSHRWIEIPHLDKIVHFFLYLITAYIWTNYLIHKIEKNKAIILGIGFGSLLGLITEYAQPIFFEGRHFEILDIVANIVGSLSGAILFYFVYPHLKR